VKTMLRSKLRRYFLAGLIVLTPVFITIYALVAMVRFADGLLGRFIAPYVQKTFGISVFGAGLLAIIILIFVSGVLATNVLVKRILPYLEKMFLRLPLAQQIYPSVKQFIKFLFSDEKLSFKKTAMFEYPRKGIYTIGFVTNEFTVFPADGSAVEVCSVYVVSAPNPITGILIIVPKNELTILDISVEEAVKLLISAGVVLPGKPLKSKQVNS